MSESKTYVFGNDANGANSNLLASLLPALQNRGIDSSYLMGLMSGNNNGGFFGNNGGFQDIIALIVIAAIFGNGNFGFGGWGNNGANANMVASTAEREMLLSAIQRNGVDLSQLASSLNCSVGKLDNAIGQVASQICSLTGQVGMSSQQIINSIQAGNATLASQLASCCCDIRQQISDCCCRVERGIDGVNYNMATNTCAITNNATMNTRDIIEAVNTNYRALHDELVANRIEDKNAQIQAQQNEINSLRLAASQERQNNYLTAAMDANVAEILRRTGNDCPVAAYVVQPSTPVTFPTNCCGQFTGYQNNNGCGS